MGEAGLRNKSADHLRTNIRFLKEHRYHRRGGNHHYEHSEKSEDHELDLKLNGCMNSLQLAQQVASEEDYQALMDEIKAEDEGEQYDHQTVGSFLFGCTRDAHGISNRYCTPCCANSLVYGKPGTCDGQVWILEGNTLTLIRNAYDLDGHVIPVAYVFTKDGDAFHLDVNTYQELYNNDVRTVKFYSYDANNHFNLVAIYALQRNEETAEIEAAHLPTDGIKDAAIIQEHQANNQTTTSDGVPWYQNPWVWVAIVAAVLLVFVIALSLMY